MNTILTLLAVLSLWDYPARFPQHERLRVQFTEAVREGDTETMVETCRKGVQLLPDDPTWQYNLACALAYFKDPEPALEALEKAIDLGFRDAEAIRVDSDLKRVANHPRFRELLQYAGDMSTKPLRSGPLSGVAATGLFGEQVTIGEQNLAWDFDNGCFEAKLKLAVATSDGNVGDLYFNRDERHSYLKMADFPGLTEVRLDAEGRKRHADVNAPNMLFPYPVFGNCSRAFLHGPYWRSIPRSLMTSEAGRMKSMMKFYLSNQTWVFPSNSDTAPIGTNGDVFASITPYWITTAGRSWSDLPYLRAALTASQNFQPDVKRRLVANGLLAATIQTLIRKSLVTVSNETDYLSYKAHPTAFPPHGVDLQRLTDAAARLTTDAIAPLAPMTVGLLPPQDKKPQPEVTYVTPFATAIVLRSDDMERTFILQAQGAQEFAFVQTHGLDIAVKIEKIRNDAAKIVLNRKGMGPTKRVDIAVFGRNPGSQWGAPSYLSIARMDPFAPYSDPALTILPDPPKVTK